MPLFPYKPSPNFIKSWILPPELGFFIFSYQRMPNCPRKILLILLPFSLIRKSRLFLSFLGYHSNHWVDEPILGFLSIFSTEEKPSMIFNFSQFLVDNIHEQFLKLQTEGMFKYASILVYMFLFYQAYNLPFAVQNMNEQGKPH